MNQQQVSLWLAHITKLDSWDVGSILGGVNFLLKQSAINAVVRRLPEIPEEGSGLENFARWEQQQRDPEIRAAAAPLLGLVDQVGDVMETYSTNPISTYEEVLAFMMARPPKRESFIDEYKHREALGMKPGVSIREFVDMEYAQALQRHGVLQAKGEAAVHVLNQIEGTDEQCPEWVYEAIHAKILQKLAARWSRAELRRTNPRIAQKQRDEARANQVLIEACLLAMDGEIPKDSDAVEPEVEQEIDAFLRKAQGVDGPGETA